EERLSSRSRSRSLALSLSFSQSLSPEATRRRRGCHGADGRCGCDDAEISRLGNNVDNDDDDGDDDDEDEDETSSSSFSCASSSSSSSSSSSATPLGFHSDWTSEDDKRLVELVLEKLKLSKRDWNECARKMGKDNDSVGRRWKALVGEGNVGLRRGRRVVRSRIHESWR
ncbi:hypothetical protein ACJ72_08640, partial [Emergomyces africanus]